MVESVILDVCNFLKTKHILISSQNSWLRGCIACFKESSPNFTSSQLRNFVFDQWKLADLNDVSAPSLPNNCRTALKLTLSGKYAVQINYAVNIGESFYKQLQKIRRPAAEDNLSVDTEKDKSTNDPAVNRTFKLELTDGVVTLLGFEEEPIKKLIHPFVPGVKAILNGPIVCRKGVLFLRHESIDILGGEVDTLHVSNAAENVIARTLKQPENPEPFKIWSNPTLGSEHIDLDIPEDDIDVFLQIPEELTNSSTITQSDHHSENANSSHKPSNNKSVKKSLYPNVSQPSKSISTYSTTVINDSKSNQGTSLVHDLSLDTSVTELEDDDEFEKMAAETASLAEKTIGQNKTPVVNKQSSLHNYFPNKSSDTGAVKNISNSITNSNNHSKNNINPNKNNGKTSSNKSKHLTHADSHELRSQMEDFYSNFYDSESETYTSIFKKDSNDLSASDKKISSNTNDKLKKSGGRSQVTNKTVSESEQENKFSEEFTFPPKKYPCTRILKVSVEDVSEKLAIRENKWILSAIVKIHEVEIDVEFSSETLDKIIGITATDLLAKRKTFIHNSELKVKMNDLLKSSQRKIQQLNCNMEVQFISSNTKPVIRQILC